MDSIVWNPWHGCKKYSPGCKNCYVYRRDSSVGRDASKVEKTKSFDLPLERKKNYEFKIPSGTLVYTCMTSDFFLDTADEWREDIWRMMRQRSDLDFMIITKRITRFSECIPLDWGKGYDNVMICCTIENQEQCDIRFPVFNSLPIRKKFICCEPLLSDIDMSSYLNKDILQVLVGGESGNDARICDYNWILNIRRQCIKADVPFYFKQTGAKFLKDGILYRIPRKFQHSQAKKANIATNTKIMPPVSDSE